MSYSGAGWGILVGILGILNGLILHHAPVEVNQRPGPPRDGALPFSVVLLIFGPISALRGLWMFLWALMSSGVMLRHFPIMWTNVVLVSGSQLVLAPVLIIGAVKRLGARPTPLRVPSLVIGILTVVIGVVSIGVTLVRL